MTEYYKCLFKPYLDRFREIEKKIQRDDFVGETQPSADFLLVQQL